MSTPNTKRVQLIAKLKEMFQMDQADLDFGIYRIMNAKRDEVERFLDKDLLPTLRTTLEEFQPAGLADKQKELADAIANARKLKIDPDSLEIVQQLKAELAEGGDLDRLENQVYSDLHTFFSRYYQDGDFLSLRRYKEGVYAMPYEGEEVKLHWANADQYYIKTAENFTRYAFKTAQGRVRFELAAASTERDNNKATADNERSFILAAEPLTVDGNELIIRFEYRHDADKRKQKELSTLAVTSLLALPEGAPLTKGVPQWLAWRAALANTLPSDKNKTRTVFEKHLTDYTAKNTFDYFIHKDLGAFLKRELDFFIKNEVMHLDDIEEDSASRVESYLARIKAMRRISHKLIAFLAQLENFQKKLWLKKKFVLETNWLISLDRIPEEMYPEICLQAENSVCVWDGRTRSQREEWVELFAIDKIAGDLAGAVAYSIPLKSDFLKANGALILDTAYFNTELKEQILSAFPDVDGAADGLLCQGQNFHGLNLIGERYRESVKSIYIDPPYNTGSGDFLYRDGYKNSAWLSMMTDALLQGKNLLRPDAAMFVSIDDNESHRLKILLEKTFGQENHVADIVWQKRYAPDVRTIISDAHEYIHCYAVDREKFGETRRKLPLGDAQTKQFDNIDKDPRGPWKADNFTAQGYRPNQMYEVTNPVGEVMTPPPGRCWMVTEPKYKELIEDKRMYFGRDGRGRPAVKRFLAEMDGMVPWTWWSSQDVGHSQDGMKETVSYFGRDGAFLTAKPLEMIKRVVRISSGDDDLVVDFFAGSGTTGDAVMRLNREEGCKRRFILVEAGNHFDSKLKVRIQKAAYASKWREGVPEKSEHCSVLIKYIRLESYDDVCNNLALSRADDQQRAIDQAPTLREGYFLNYMLNVESRASLLNLDNFIDPFNVHMTLARNDESRVIVVDMIETFNYLLGLRVQTMRRVEGVYEVVGVTPAGDQVLILWRDVTAVSNDMLDEWFRKQAYSSRDKEFDLIYVNGDNNIENLRRTDETWKVRLTEETFLGLMFGTEMT
jgi:adenine-specific DNA-methyltransferase